jgi:hypothetical protein
MNLFKNYFNKEKIIDITYDDIVNYFSQSKHENDKIEYKSFVIEEKENQTSKERQILKTICGFLNSEGGILIWGAPKGKIITGKREKIFQGDPSMVDFLYEKDSFISKVTDSITPAPRNILFHRIDEREKHIYVFEIPKSEYSPHQFQNTYYMRIDGQTRPAPHHYVEALMKQIRFPNLEGYIMIDNIQYTSNELYLYIQICIFNLSKLQNDYNVTYRLLCSQGLWEGWNNPIKQENIKFADDGHQKIVENLKGIIHFGNPVAHKSTIIFNPYEIERNNFQPQISLFFGAKLSPMKVSSYNINLKHPFPRNFQDIILGNKLENRFMYEMPEDLENNERNKILRLLGREQEIKT